AWVALAIGVLVIASDLSTTEPVVPAAANGWMIAALGWAWIACLWDGRVSSAVLGLYFTGIAACGAFVESLGLDLRWTIWLGSITLASYNLLTCYLWSRREGLAMLAARLRMPVAAGHRNLPGEAAVLSGL